MQGTWISACRIIVLIGVACSVFFPDDATAKSDKKTTTIFRHWRFIAEGDEEVIMIDQKTFHCRLSGKGLPHNGLEMEKGVAAVMPSPNAKEGRLVIGPDETQSQPYQIIYWKDLGSDEVKIWSPSKVYPTVEAAQNATNEVDKEHVKTYRALQWGI